MKRRLEPELLDILPPDDPQAIHSRRDLRRINRAMFQAQIMRRLFRRYLARPPRCVIELGGGDGYFMLRLARALQWRDVKYILVDRQNIVDPKTAHELRERNWHLEIFAEDMSEFLRRGIVADLITVNLFLHHFSESRLSDLFARASALAPVLVACEPRRNRFALAASGCVTLIGCNRVTRHDAVASVRAGFCGRELSALWPTSGGWQLHEYAAPPFTHCFIAHRDAHTSVPPPPPPPGGEAREFPFRKFAGGGISDACNFPSGKT
jgi:hypothetical protein